MYIIIIINDIMDFFYTVLYFYFFPFLFFALLIYIFMNNAGTQRELNDTSINLDKVSLDILFMKYKEYYENINTSATNSTLTK